MMIYRVAVDYRRFKAKVVVGQDGTRVYFVMYVKYVMYVMRWSMMRCDMM